MATPATAPLIQRRRIESIDLLRGTVMLIMALDHVRDYFHNSAFLFNPTDLTHTSTVLFFTRWITHFCAPVFAFLAGVSACISGNRKSRKALSAFLFTRGLWLMIAEIVLITLSWTFNPHYTVFILQVIWALGFGMICLSLLVFLPRPLILVTGLVLVLGHNTLDNIHVAGNGFGAYGWAFLHDQHFFASSHVDVFMGYPVIPWVGIMTLGYCTGYLYLPPFDAARRKKWLVYLGSIAIAVFIVLRMVNVYGDPSPRSTGFSSWFNLLSFLNTTKYPPSLLYTLMTLGPALLFLAFTERPLNAFTQKVVVFGRVPMFYYIVHIVLIHLAALVAAEATGYSWHNMILTTWVTEMPQLKGYGFSLPVVYLLWLVTIVILYPLCKWYDRYKTDHREQWWLSYV